MRKKDAENLRRKSYTKTCKEKASFLLSFSIRRLRRNKGQRERKATRDRLKWETGSRCCSQGKRRKTHPFFLFKVRQHSCIVTSSSSSERNEKAKVARFPLHLFPPPHSEKQEQLSLSPSGGHCFPPFLFKPSWVSFSLC